MTEKQTVCLRRLGGDRAGEVKLGRWISNQSVTKEELIETIRGKSKPFVKGKHLLGIQDTTELNYESKVNKIKGLGPVGNGRMHGFYLHAMLLVDADEGTCLGFGDLRSWSRTGIKKKFEGDIYRKQLIEDKESYRWIDSAEKGKEVLETARQITIVADRESDIYEEWCRVPDSKTHLLTRACQDRMLSNGNRLFFEVSKLTCCGIYELNVRGKSGKRSAHVAKLAIRFGEVEVKKPKQCTDKSAPASVKLRVVDVREIEETVIKDEEPIHWCLLTTHCVETEEAALQIIDWYCQRWNIEQFFRLLQKQGLDVESSQIETIEGLTKLVIVACFAALCVMQLTLSREGKDQLISVVFNKMEHQLLSKLQKKLEGKTQQQKNPHKEKMLSWAAWIIARLGGWKGYGSESPPGPITMFRGFQRFQSIYEGWSLGEMCA